MKLRNKKTGDVGICNLRIVHSMEAPLLYHSLAEVNRDWEDYEPKEPLIKDEKVRKAVRAWAEAIDAETLFVEQANFDGEFLELTDVISSIRFAVKRPKDIKAGERYTIEELCGEEEECES